MEGEIADRGSFVFFKGREVEGEESCMLAAALKGGEGKREFYVFLGNRCVRGEKIIITLPPDPSQSPKAE